MSDLVEQLHEAQTAYGQCFDPSDGAPDEACCRDVGFRYGHLFWEAADEIERLRDAAVIARTTEANLHDEIELLRGLLREVAEEMTGDCCLTDEAIADGLIERVREALGDE